ncbi:Nucleoside diphosphate kinase family protein [Perilla frutescens var. hirtella]|uniref:nucleoside-diphosphate kinase n=1 Tax=Perilla frutescens var. hirtella TaxID=608512 RepID=A0AAD4IQ55_PERFH|nr:Nucleoside diphosphate kinase family protein [Perilla frutescens var. hirtella]
MRAQISRSARSLLSAATKRTACSFSGGQATSVVSCRRRVSSFASYSSSESGNAYRRWISGVLTLPAAAFMLQDQETNAAQMEITFIAKKPDGMQVQRRLISEIISRFERKGFKLVAIKVVIPSKDFAQNNICLE